MAEQVLFLTFVGGPRDRQTVRFDKALVMLGRDPASDVPFDPYKELEVSAQHATLRRQEQGFALEDTSRNGTFLNGDRVRERTPLRHGDLIQLGSAGPVLRMGLGRPAPALMANRPAPPGSEPQQRGAPPPSTMAMAAVPEEVVARHELPIEDLPTGAPVGLGAEDQASGLTHMGPRPAAPPGRGRLPSSPGALSSLPLRGAAALPRLADDDDEGAERTHATDLAQLMGSAGLAARVRTGDTDPGTDPNHEPSTNPQGSRPRPATLDPLAPAGAFHMPLTRMVRAEAGDLDELAALRQGAPGAPSPPLHLDNPDDRRPRLQVERLDGDGYVLELVGEVFRLGRDPRSELPFDEEAPEIASEVAFNHAKVVYYHGEYVLFDNDSPQKTYVDGKPVVRLALKGNEVITLGKNGPKLRLRPLPPRAAAASRPAGAGAAALRETGRFRVDTGRAPATTPPSGKTRLNEISTSLTDSGRLSDLVRSGRFRMLTDARGEATRATSLRDEHGQPSPDARQATDRRKRARLLKEIPLTGDPVEIGRLGGLGLTLDSLHVSNRHARLEWRHVPDSNEPLPHVIDLGSANGTFLRGELITESRIQVGDELEIGPFFIDYSGAALRVYDCRQSSVSAHRITRRDPRTGRAYLQDVSLVVRPAEFVCLLGPSGSGKSTLLKTLSGAETADNGTVYLNDTDFHDSYAQLKYQVGYVPQEDIVHPELTVRRTLEYAARLRLPREIDDATALKRIEEVLSILELADHAEKPVRMLSGGQRKRVSIGVELLTEPGLLYLDEPTSGLDPNLEEKMMLLCRELSLRGNTVVCVTHVLDNIHLADKVGLLYEGRLIFFGTPREALKHFDVERMTEIYKRLDEVRDAEALNQRFLESEAYARHLAAEVLLLDEKANDRAGTAPRTGAAPGSETNPGRGRDATPAVSGAGPLQQLVLLTRRYFEILTRDARNTALLVLQAPIVGAIISLAIPTHKLSRSPTSTLMLVMSLSALWFGCSNAAREITKEQGIYARERMVSLRIFPYVGSKFLVLQLLSLVQCVILQMIVLRFSGTAAMRLLGSSPELWFKLLLNLYLLSLTGIGIGLFLSAYAENSDKAMALVPIVLIPQILLSGGFGLFPASSVVRPLSYAMSLNWSLDGAKRIALCPLGEEVRCLACLTPVDPYLEEADPVKLSPELRHLKEKLPNHCVADDQRTRSETTEVIMDGLYGPYELVEKGQTRARVSLGTGMSVLTGMSLLLFLSVGLALRRRERLRLRHG